MIHLTPSRPGLARRFSLFFILLCSTAILGAQRFDDPKEGRVTDEERAMLSYPPDTSAEAVVLFDRIDLGMIWNSQDGPQVSEQRHRRVKLLKPSSFDRADIVLDYNRDNERIGDFDAFVHLPNGETIKMKKSDIIREQVADDHFRVKVTLPQIEVGAIIEYSYYNVRESITFLPRYVFQEDIPVLWAEYRSLIPEYYQYIGINSTVAKLAVSEANRILVNWGPSVANNPTGRPNGVYAIQSRYVMRDIPAFRAEPYTNNLRDYLPQIRQQLNGVRYHNQGTQQVLQSWEALANRLTNMTDFGIAYRNKLNRNGAWREAEPVVSKGTTAAERTALAYNFVASRVRWNEKTRVFAEQTPDQTLKSGSGSTADMNLLLCALLNEADVTAYPLLYANRDGGTPIELYPLFDQFQSVMVYAMIEGGPVLLDVNGTDRPPGLPRASALNRRGWVVHPSNPQWVDLAAPASRLIVMSDLTLAEDGVATGTIRTRQENYFAQEGRHTIGGMKQPAEAPVLNEIAELMPTATFTDYESDVEDRSNVGQLNGEARATLPLGEAVGEFIYLRPFPLTVVDKQLADNQARKFPVDMNYPWRKQFITSIELPEGYTVDELPEPISVVTPDRQAQVRYSISVGPSGALKATLSVDMLRTYYATEEYEPLRTVFNHILRLQDSPVVLKKAAK